MNTDTVYVSLLDEGTDVRRPVPATRVSPGVWRLERTDDYDPEFETWEFLPGTAVRCVERESSGKNLLIATQQVDGL